MTWSSSADGGQHGREVFEVKIWENMFLSWWVGKFDVLMKIMWYMRAPEQLLKGPGGESVTLSNVSSKKCTKEFKRREFKIYG